MASVSQIYVMHGAATSTPCGAEEFYNVTVPRTDVGTKVSTAGHVRFKQADDSLKDTNNPIPIPADVASEYQYSYSKSMRIGFLTTPPNMITNVRWYSAQSSDVTYGGEIKDFLGVQNVTHGVVLHVGVTTAYSQGVSTNVDTDVLTGNVDGYQLNAQYYAGSPFLTICAGTLVDNTMTTYPGTATPQTSEPVWHLGGSTIQPFVVQQMRVGYEAAAGDTRDHKYLFRYDEQ